MTRSKPEVVLHSFDHEIEKTLHSLNKLSKVSNSNNTGDLYDEFDTDNNNISSHTI